MVHHRPVMDVDLQAIAHSYGPGAEEYARKFGDDLITNEFDRRVLDGVLGDSPARALVLDIGCGRRRYALTLVRPVTRQFPSTGPSVPQRCPLNPGPPPTM